MLKVALQGATFHTQLNILHSTFPLNIPSPNFHLFNQDLPNSYQTLSSDVNSTFEIASPNIIYPGNSSKPVTPSKFDILISFSAFLDDHNWDTGYAGRVTAYYASYYAIGKVNKSSDILEHFNLIYHDFNCG